MFLSFKLVCWWILERVDCLGKKIMSWKINDQFFIDSWRLKSFIVNSFLHFFEIRGAAHRSKTRCERWNHDRKIDEHSTYCFCEIHVRWDFELYITEIQKKFTIIIREFSLMIFQSAINASFVQSDTSLFFLTNTFKYKANLNVIWIK